MDDPIGEAMEREQEDETEWNLLVARMKEEEETSNLPDEKTKLETLADKDAVSVWASRPKSQQFALIILGCMSMSSKSVKVV